MNRLKRVLVPVDFSPLSPSVLDHACELARRYEAELYLLHVLSDSGRAVGHAGGAEERHIEALKKLDRALAPESARSLEVVRRVRCGLPGPEIVRYAEENHIDLIVMGTHGRTGLTRAVLGSVADRVLRSASCPVVVIQQRKDASRRYRLLDAAKALTRRFGTLVPGDREESRSRMLLVLAESFELEEREATALLDELQAWCGVAWIEPEEKTGGGTEPGWAIDLVALDQELERTSAWAAAEKRTAEANEALDLLDRALQARASDIHIDPKGDDDFRVRFRIDGHLEPFCNLARSVAVQIQHQLAILANLDIADPFTPKEGRIGLPESLAGVEVRVTTAPAPGGQAMALRLLHRDRVLLPIGDLGLSLRSLEAVDQMLHHRAGLVLVTGPTGSGKTTTVYSLLKQLDSGERNIVTIEDPIEFRLPFLRQMEVDLRHNLDLARGLRTALRMDPDVVFVSEIRDVQAAETAMRAASSGRYVFSTLHTRDVASTVTALRDLRVDGHSLSGNLVGIIAQRLVRRLCPNCCERSPIDEAERQVFLAEKIEPPAELARAKGCPECRGTGYRERIGVFETVLISGALASAIQAGSPEEEIRRVIRSSGAPSLLADALLKVRDGVTSLEEAQGMMWV